MARRKKPPRRLIEPPSEADAPFIDAILAAPDDDAPRLVYADHLLEHGDAVHGELITVQCTRARLEREAPATAEYRAAWARELELRAVVDAAWLRTFGVHELQGVWARGFIEEVRGASPIGLRAHMPLLSRHPVRAVRTFDARGGDRSPSLAELRWIATEMATLRSVAISSYRGSADLVASGLPSGEDPSWDVELPHVALHPAVRALHFPHPTTERLDALASARLPALRQCHLSTQQPRPVPSFEYFVRSPAFASLEELSVESYAQSTAVVVLLHAQPGLRVLTLRCSDPWSVDGVLMRTLAACAALPTLEHVDVTCPHDAELVAALAERAPRLESLVISGGVTSANLACLVASAIAPRLRQLEIACARWERVSASSFATAGFQRLTSLSLSRVILDHDFAAAPSLETLVRLRLVQCEATPEVKAAIAARWPFVSVV